MTLASSTVPAARPVWWRQYLRRILTRPVDGLESHISRFAIRERWKRHRVATIAETFLLGYNAFVLASTPDDIHASLAGLDPYFRPFGYEGAAMGFGAWAWTHGLGLDTFEAFVHHVSPGTLYQNYVGLGWWFGLWVRAPRRIADLVNRFDHRYGVIVYEGLGFRRGFLRPFDPKATRMFDRFERAARHVCFQGYGRSLWFVHMDALEDAFGRIADLPEDVAGDCVSGIGLGAAYSMLDQLNIFGQVLRQVPPRHRLEFLQGAAFGWETRQLADRPYFDEMVMQGTDRTRRHIADAVQCVHEAKRLLERRGATTSFYEQWRGLTRQMVQDNALFAQIDG